MPPDLSIVDDILNKAIPEIAPSAQLAVRYNGQSIFSRAYGFLDPDTKHRPVHRTSLFDIASITKLFTSTAFMRLVEEGLVSLDQPVCEILPEFSGIRPILPYEDPQNNGGWIDVTGQANQPDRSILTVDAGKITFRQILRHSSGLPAWRPLHGQPNAVAAAQMAVGTFFACLPDTRVLYSDIGMIILGLAVSRITGHNLQRIIEERVTGPLGLARTRFLPVGNTIPLDVAPTGYCAWRKRWVVGEVHDESACRLGGTAGHAGLFSTADEIARFGQSFLPETHLPLGTAPLTRPLRPSAIAEMTKLQFQDHLERRGLGFALWSASPENSGSPFSTRAFGHTGFTGCSLWIDPDRQLVTALLANDIFYGRQNRRIAELRLSVHRAVVQAIDHTPGS